MKDLTRYRILQACLVIFIIMTVMTYGKAMLLLQIKTMELKVAAWHRMHAVTDPVLIPVVRELHYQEQRLKSCANHLRLSVKRFHPDNVCRCLKTLEKIYRKDLIDRLEGVNDNGIPQWVAALKHLLIYQLEHGVEDPEILKVDRLEKIAVSPVQVCKT